MKGLEVLSEEEERGSGLMHTMVLSYVSLSHSHFYLTRNTTYLIDSLPILRKNLVC